MYIAIDRHRASDLVVPLHAPDRHRDVVDHAKALTMIGKRMMKASADIEGDTVFEGETRGKDCAAGGEPERIDHLARIRNLEFQDVLIRQRAGSQFGDPGGIVHQQDIVVACGLWGDEVFSVSEVRTVPVFHGP